MSHDDVIGVVDQSGNEPRFVISDTGSEDAWISVLETESIPVDVWC